MTGSEARRMTSSETGGKNIARRFQWLLVGIVAVVLLYTAGWYYAASRLLDETRQVLADMGRQGNRTVCEAPAVHGYPFRIGLYCDATYVERATLGAAVSTGAFRSAAQIYDPTHVVAEADAPARVTLPGLVPLDVAWEALRASARLARPLPSLISIEGRKVSALADMPNVAGPAAFSADRLELYLRPDGKDLDVASRFEAFEPGRLLIGDGKLPPLSGAVDLTVKDGVARLRARRGELRGISLELRQVEIASASGAALTASGTVAVDDGGVIDARLTLGARKPAELAAVLSAAFPAEAGRINSAFAGLATLGDNPSLPLTIRQGQAFLGFIPLGTIPPL
jgi:hypothetical protein